MKEIEDKDIRHNSYVLDKSVKWPLTVKFMGNYRNRLGGRVDVAVWEAGLRKLMRFMVDLVYKTGAKTNIPYDFYISSVQDGTVRVSDRKTEEENLYRAFIKKNWIKGAGKTWPKWPRKVSDAEYWWVTKKKQTGRWVSKDGEEESKEDKKTGWWEFGISEVFC